MSDPNFIKSVVLLVSHNDDGAMGLVLNRPLNITLRQACEDEDEIEQLPDTPLRAGGPCNGPLMVLHDQAEAADTTIAESLYFTLNRDYIRWLLKQPDARMRFFAGYSGWGKGQLEAEIEEGAWIVFKSSPEIVFDDVQGRWSTLMTRATLGDQIDPRRIPPDPQVN